MVAFGILIVVIAVVVGRQIGSVDWDWDDVEDEDVVGREPDLEAGQAEGSPAEEA